MTRTRAQIRGAVERFERVTVKHKLQEEALQAVLFMLELSPNTSIINLIGPTGVGKSVLQRRVFNAVVDEHRVAMERDKDFAPIIHTSAMAAGYRLFDWRVLYATALAELGDVFAAGRCNRGGYARYDSDPTPFKRAGESKTAASLRMRLEAEFGLRRTRVWVIDEAQHMIFGRAGKPGDQFDVLKSIADRTGVKLLLAGPHQMEPALGTSGQLARRSSTVSFGRYQSADPRHMKTFASVADTLLRAMNLSGYPSVRESLTLLYAGSAGCVGILKDWLARAYGSALRQQVDERAPVLTLDDLRRTRLSLKAMETIIADIRSAEEGAQDDAGDDDYERIVLGRSPTQERRQPPQASAKGKSKGRRVGVRVPSRDPVPVDTVPPAGAPRLSTAEVPA